MAYKKGNIALNMYSQHDSIILFSSALTEPKTAYTFYTLTL